MTPANRTLTGIALMLCAMAMLPFLDVVAKFLGQQGVPVVQIVWARMTLGCVMTLPFAIRIGGAESLLPARPIMHAFRAAFLIAATGFFFWGLKFTSIAGMLSIFFVYPLALTMLSPFVLGEKVGIRRWTAVVIGFIGTLIIIRPGFQEFNAGAVLALAAGASFACYMLMTRRISGSDHAMLTTFHTNLAGAVLTSLVVVFFWKAPTAFEWSMFVLLAAIAATGHYFIVRAYEYAEASLLAPLAYTEIITAIVAGWWFFGDFPDGWAFVGVSILIACAIYISFRERVRRIPASHEFEQL